MTKKEKKNKERKKKEKKKETTKERKKERKKKASSLTDKQKRYLDFAWVLRVRWNIGVTIIDHARILISLLATIWNEDFFLQMCGKNPHKPNTWRINQSINK